MKKGLPFWLSLLINTLLWLILGIVIYVSTKEANIWYGILIIYFFIVVSMIFGYRAQWSGKIVEIKKDFVGTNDDYGGRTQADFAYLELENGKKKKIRAEKGWSVGDKLEKVRGEAKVQKV